MLVTYTDSQPLLKLHVGNSWRHSQGSSLEINPPTGTCAAHMASVSMLNFPESATEGNCIVLSELKCAIHMT